MSRDALLSRLQEETFDLLVIGGGITGAGIARDAALRGLRVALVEKSDLAHGTSSASSKLIHGGLRYLEQLELGLVREGVRERGLLMKNAPHLARPLPFLFPIYEDARVGTLQVRIGMWLYDLLSGFSSHKLHRMLARRKAREAEPELLERGLRGAAVYYDCLTQDARLTLETALDAEDHGALVATYVEAAEFTTDAAGKTTGALVRDRLAGDGPANDGGGGQPFPLRARVTALAAGPWTDRLLKAKLGRDLLRPTKGSHLVVDRARLPIEHAVVLTHPSDGRVMFAIPWGARTVVGTTDTDEGEPPDGLEASRADVDYMLAIANRYFPRAQLGHADVIATWSGLRPLMGASDDLDPSEVSREHAILNVDPGLVAIAGGKLTTYRLMSEQLVDKVVKKLGYKVKLEPCRTQTTPLRGASDPQALRDLDACARELAREEALDEDVALHLIASYGLKARDVLAAGQAARTRPGRLVKDLPYLVDEVAYAVTREKAERLDDVLRRRTLVFLQDREQGLSVCEETARIMAELKGWDRDRTALEVARYRGLVEASRAWQRQGAPAPAA